MTAEATEPLFPAFLKLAGRQVVLVGGGPVALAKFAIAARGGRAGDGGGARGAARAARAGRRRPVQVRARPFVPADLDGAWFVVAAAPPEVNRQVQAAAEARCLFVNAVDDPAAATAYSAAVIRRGPVTVAFSTGGAAPALAGLIREGLESLLPEELDRWGEAALAARAGWKAEALPMAARRPRLLRGAEPALRGSAVMTGRVSLVGAGPGDADLLTVRAQRRLGEADLVLFDALAAPELRALAPEARWFYVGKRAGRDVDGPGGDQPPDDPRGPPGQRRGPAEGRRPIRARPRRRGGAGAGRRPASPSRSSPGSRARWPRPALAGIPVTHRGLASAFVVLSGHAASAYGPVIDGLNPGAVTVVVLMGLCRAGGHRPPPAGSGLRPPTRRRR